MSLGAKAHDDFFTEYFGSRWPELKCILAEKDKHIARTNPHFIPTKDIDHRIGIGSACEQQGLENCYEITDNFDLKNYDQLTLPFYKMDAASVIAARSLQVESGDLVLDMCAAPGGKSLVLMESLQKEGRLIANEYSTKRKYRMMSVFKRYLSVENKKRVSIKGMDGSQFGLRQKDTFDKVLIDAPCSGDRDLIQKPKNLEGWKPKRSKNFGVRQYSLLASGLSCLKPGGKLLYSTCSMSPFENDEVIAKLKKRRGDEFKSLTSHLTWGDKTEYGRLILPDTTGYGPIFYAYLQKL